MTKSSRAILVCAIPVLMVAFNSELRGAGASAQPPDVDIFTASAEGSLQAIRQHIAAGTDLDVIEPAGGGTPLIVTTVSGQTAAAKLLIENGASLNATNNDGSTALHTAAFFGHPDTVKLLLEYGAEVNVRNAIGGTPLDNVADEWTDELEGFYRMVAGILQLELDLERIKAARPVVAKMLRENGGKTGR